MGFSGGVLIGADRRVFSLWDGLAIRPSHGGRNKFPMFEPPRRACSVEAVILH